jgi:sec-independent protein translocase protein TatA
MFGSFGWMELLLILIIVLIIFGAGKIPQLGEGLGKAIKGFKKSVNEPDPVDVTAVPAPPEQEALGSRPAQPGTGQSGGQSQAQPGHQHQMDTARRQTENSR